MRRMLLAMLIAVVAAAAAAAQEPKPDSYVGQWTGTWEGAGNGVFELLLSKDGDTLGGKVSVTTDGGNYTADLRNVAVKGTTLDAAYDFPLDPSAEVVMTATIDGTTAKGKWSLKPKAGGDEVAGGTFPLSKK
jgi:opacity protein-like surface antigen